MPRNLALHNAHARDVNWVHQRLLPTNSGRWLEKKNPTDAGSALLKLFLLAPSYVERCRALALSDARVRKNPKVWAKRMSVGSVFRRICICSDSMYVHSLMESHTVYTDVSFQTCRCISPHAPHCR